MHPLAKLDHQYLWHPFTQMRDWLKREPIVITDGQGARLRDARGREYLDANSSIWTNLHGHNHPQLNGAIRRQLARIAHSSALGLANEPASLLAQKLVQAANPPLGISADAMTLGRRSPGPKLAKVFFSDDGSTAVEVALKLAYEYARRTGHSRRRPPRFLSLEGAYHGDTVGAVSLGHIDLFHQTYSGLLFRSDKVMAPYCYRCPYNRARPERADARAYRKCNWECLDKIEQKFAAQKKKDDAYAAFVFEPLIQGAAGMIPQPAGWLARAGELARAHGALLLADEVMTAFGRTGVELEPGQGGKRVVGLEHPPHSPAHSPLLPASLFASPQAGIQPDLLALAKGLTGGYLPMGATLTSQPIFEAFLGKYEDFKTFFHGHSYTANQLGAAAALASLNLLQSPTGQRARRDLGRALSQELQTLWRQPRVGDIRQVGLITGIELVKNWRTREPFDLRQRVGLRVCEAMAQQGVLTRPIGNVIVLMPPYCTTAEQVGQMVAALGKAVARVVG